MISQSWPSVLAHHVGVISPSTTSQGTAVVSSDARSPRMAAWGSPENPAAVPIPETWSTTRHQRQARRRSPSTNAWSGSVYKSSLTCRGLDARPPRRGTEKISEQCCPLSPVQRRCLTVSPLQNASITQPRTFPAPLPHTLMSRRGTVCGSGHESLSQNRPERFPV